MGKNVKVCFKLDSIFTLEVVFVREYIYRVLGLVGIVSNNQVFKRVVPTYYKAKEMLSQSLFVLRRVVVLAIIALCPSVEPGSWVSVPEEQPVVEATEVIKEAGFQIDDARHRVLATAAVCASVHPN